MRFATKPRPTRPSAAPSATSPDLDCSPVFGNSGPLGFSGVGGVTGVGGVGAALGLVGLGLVAKRKKEDEA